MRRFTSSLLAACILGLAAAVVLIALSVSDVQQEQQVVELETLQNLESADAHFAACYVNLKGEGMPLVMQVDQKCGDVFTASQCTLACKQAATELSSRMGCCWQPLITGFAKVQPSAAHAWHSWTFNLENLCGVSVAASCQAKDLAEQTNRANDATSIAEKALEEAREEEEVAQQVQKSAVAAQDQAQKLQDEMQNEEEKFLNLKKHFKSTQADAARAVIVERMVHNSVKKDLQSAWGLHQQVNHDKQLANKLAQGTQVEQENARELLKSAHAAKNAVHNMADVAKKAKHAAFKLHKIATLDLQRAAKMSKFAALQKKIADKAHADVLRELEMSKKVIAASESEQKKAKKIWGALEDEKEDFDKEKSDAVKDAGSEAKIGDKIDDEIGDAQKKFAAFEDSTEAVEKAVAEAEDLVKHVAGVEEETQKLLEASKAQERRVHHQKFMLNAEEAELMMGHKGVIALEGELDVLRNRYLDLRRKIAATYYHARRYPPDYYEYEREQEENNNNYYGGYPPYRNLVVPMPPRTHIDVHATTFNSPQNPMLDQEQQ